MHDLIVLSFYKFAPFPDHAAFKKPLKELFRKLNVSGGVILAPEGINGSICGTREKVEIVLEYIQSDNRLKGIRQVQSPTIHEEGVLPYGQPKISAIGASENDPFRWDHVRIKLKKEIVCLGIPAISPIERVGVYVKPKDWNNLITDPDTVVIDVRNSYETRIGKFRRAIDPKTKAFRDFPSWVKNQFQITGPHLDISAYESSDFMNEIQENQRPRIAMYCTGGIRCEKASSYLLSIGFNEVYHLEGGIVNYLEEIGKGESLWDGECFVFDKRVSVEHGLLRGTYKLCYGCKQPVSDADMEAPQWEWGVSCPHCFPFKTADQKDRARARHRRFSALQAPHKPHLSGFHPDSNAR